MPQRVADTLTAVKSELLGIQERLIVYRQLYAGSPEQKDALNRTAHTFFSRIHDMLLDDMFLAVSRLIDHRQTYGKDNLCLDQLRWQIEQSGESSFAASLDGDINKIKQDCKPFQEWRHNYLAHRDLTTATSVIHGTLPLPSIKLSQIDTALQGIRALLNRVETHFGKLATDYEHIPFNTGGDALVETLVRFWRQHDEEAQGSWKRHSRSGGK